MRKFYILDMDGTLCDSMGYWRAESQHITDFNDRDKVEPIYDKMREHYLNDVCLKEGAVEFLEKAKAAGIKMCIATGTRRDIAQPFLDRTGLMDYMEFYIDCYDVAAFKTDPAIYFAAAERLGADVEDCIVFEDSEYCAVTAHNAGFCVVGVYDKTTATEGNVERIADRFIKDWREIEQIFV